DAALHGVALLGVVGEGAALPFVWSGVRVGAVGASGVRVRVSVVGEGRVSVVLVDGVGGVVASVGSLVLRSVGVERAVLAGSGVGRSLFAVEWVPVPVPVPVSVLGGTSDVPSDVVVF
ncbi:hypothetical protein ACLQ2K_29700, partial [Streptomyces sp. DT17]